MIFFNPSKEIKQDEILFRQQSRSRAVNGIKKLVEANKRSKFSKNKT